LFERHEPAILTAEAAPAVLGTPGINDLAALGRTLAAVSRIVIVTSTSI
jgi:hypothetical protein